VGKQKSELQRETRWSLSIIKGVAGMVQMGYNWEKGHTTLFLRMKIKERYENK